MSPAFTEIAQLAVLTFVLTSMIGLGLSLTVHQIVAPLRDLRLVLPAIAVNFVVTPAAAWAIAEVLDLDRPLRLGLLLLGVAAGAPFLPKLAQIAHADVAYAVGLMFVLMVVSIAYVPLVLGRLVGDVEVSAWEIAQPLVFLMALPLLAALAVRARYDEAQRVAPHLSQISTVALAIALVLGLFIGLRELIDAFGTRAYVATLVFVVVCLVAGYVLTAGTSQQRWVGALGNGQRNVSAALLIATTSFTDEPRVFVMIIVGVVAMNVVMLPLAAELGRRQARGT